MALAPTVEDTFTRSRNQLIADLNLLAGLTPEPSSVPLPASPPPAAAPIPPPQRPGPTLTPDREAFIGRLSNEELIRLYAETEGPGLHAEPELVREAVVRALEGRGQPRPSPPGGPTIPPVQTPGPGPTQRPGQALGPDREAFIGNLSNEELARLWRETEIPGAHAEPELLREAVGKTLQARLGPNWFERSGLSPSLTDQKPRPGPVPGPGRPPGPEPSPGSRNIFSITRADFEAWQPTDLASQQLKARILSGQPITITELNRLFGIPAPEPDPIGGNLVVLGQSGFVPTGTRHPLSPGTRRLDVEGVAEQIRARRAAAGAGVTPPGGVIPGGGVTPGGAGALGPGGGFGLGTVPGLGGLERDFAMSDAAARAFGLTVEPGVLPFLQARTLALLGGPLTSVSPGLEPFLQARALMALGGDRNRLADPIQTELAAQTLRALRGEIGNPALERRLRDQEEALRNFLFQSVGPGYELSTPGIQALAEFRARAEELRETDRRQLLANFLPQEESRRRFTLQQPLQELELLLPEERARRQFAETFPEELRLRELPALLGETRAREQFAFSEPRRLRLSELGLLLPETRAREQFAATFPLERAQTRSQIGNTLLNQELSRAELSERLRRGQLADTLSLSQFGLVDPATLSANIRQLVPISGLFNQSDHLADQLTLLQAQGALQGQAGLASGLSNLFTQAGLAATRRPRLTLADLLASGA